MARPKPTGFPPDSEELPSPVVDNHTHFPLRPEDMPPGVDPLPTDLALERAAASGVIAAIHSACELPDLAPSVELAREHAAISLAIAIHPNEATRHAGCWATGPDGWEQTPDPHHEISLEDAVGQVAALASAHPDLVVAIGETGLDYFRTADECRPVQREAFRAHIALAKELSLPMQIHDRDAHADVVEVLRKDGAPETTVFHCFSGDAELAQILNENGWYASFAGPITFASNDALREACAVMDPSLVLVETDAPYLTPAPYRGRPNASYLMTHTMRAVAAAQDLELTQACQRVMGNTLAVYPNLRLP